MEEGSQKGGTRVKMLETSVKRTSSKEFAFLVLDKGRMSQLDAPKRKPFGKFPRDVFSCQ